MRTFNTEIPEGLKTTDTVRGLIKVLDETLAFKRFIQSEQEYIVNPVLNTNVSAFKQFLKECGDLPTIEGLPRSVYTGLILNARNLFSYKGSYEGLRILGVAIGGDIAVDSPELYPERFILLSDSLNGFLPSGLDLGIHPENASVDTFLFRPKNGLIYLFGDSTTNYYNTVSIQVASPYCEIDAFRAWLVKLIPMFIPMVDIRTCNFNIHFISDIQPIASQVPYYNPL